MNVFYAFRLPHFHSYNGMIVWMEIFECEILFFFRFNYYNFENMKWIKRDIVVYSAFFVVFIYFEGNRLRMCWR